MKLETRATFKWPSTPAKIVNANKGIVIHYDGANQNLANKTHSHCVDYWKNTRRFHMDTNRWMDIGYSYGVCPHGYVFEGRGFNREQAAQPGGNTTFHSVTLMCGPTDPIPVSQVSAVNELFAYLHSKGVKNTVTGHRDFISTSCPGDRLYKMINNGTFKPTKEDELPTPEDLWEWDGIKAPLAQEESGQKNWAPSTYLYWLYRHVTNLETKVDELTKKLG